ncbi:MAG: hypothetical protein WBW33_04585, partial [Bryobacteraceae bacterium]
SLRAETDADTAADPEPAVEAPLASEPVTVGQEEATEHIGAPGPVEAAVFDFESAGDVTTAAESMVETPSASPEVTPAETEGAVDSTGEKALPEATPQIPTEAAPQITTDEGKVDDDEL